MLLHIYAGFEAISFVTLLACLYNQLKKVFFEKFFCVENKIEIYKELLHYLGLWFLGFLASKALYKMNDVIESIGILLFMILLFGFFGHMYHRENKTTTC